MNYGRAHHVFMAEAGEGGSGGGAASDGGSAAVVGGDASAAGAAGANGAPGGGAAQPGSVLATGAAAPAAGAAAAAPAAPGPFGSIPEKYHVKNADGSPDLQASQVKWGEGHKALEQRLGAGDAPPKSADEYKINVPAALAEKVKADDLAKEPAFKDFIAKLHGAGLNQKQVDVAVGEFLQRSMNLQGAMTELSVNDCTAALKAVWTDDAAFNKNVAAAHRAASAFGDIGKLMAKYGNDPDFIQFAAKVGAEVGEDRGAPASASKMAEQDVAALQASKAYWDPKDPQHEIVKGRVAAHYAAMHGTAPKANGSMSFTTTK